MARIKIDLPNGVFEAEGDEQFIREIYRDYQVEKTSASISKVFEKENKKALEITKESYSLVKDMNLEQNQLSLAQLYQEKIPSSALERNTLFVYYLKKIATINSVTLDHIYSCYKEIGIKPPDKLRQSLADTASKKGWLNTSSMNDIQLTLKGENFIEHELPR